MTEYISILWTDLPKTGFSTGQIFEEEHGQTTVRVTNAGKKSGIYLN